MKERLLNKVANIVAKVEIAHYLLLPQCFQKLFVAETSESVYNVGKGQQHLKTQINNYEQIYSCKIMK